MVDVTINGTSISVDAPADTPLLWVIREELKLDQVMRMADIPQIHCCGRSPPGRSSTGSR